MSNSLNIALKRLYAAAGDFSLWPEALRSLEDLAGSAGATINFVPKEPHRPGFVLAGRFTADICEEYARDYMPICPRIRFGIRQNADISYDSLIFTEAEMNRDPVYNWFGKLGLRYHVGTRMPSIEGYDINFSFQRSIGQGHVQEDDIALFRDIAAHVEQAVALGARLGSLQQRLTVTESLLDRLPQAIVILGAQREILMINHAADRLLQKGSGLIARGNILSVESPAAQMAFDNLLLRVAGSSEGPRGHGGWLKVDREAGLLPLSIMVAPMTFDLGLRLAARPVAIAVIHDGGATAKADEMLIGLFELTPTEARLAALVGQGESLDQAALRLGQATGTARIHLKSIFRKTGVSRQQELVHLVSSLVSQGFTA